jgi:hypothetical protein
MWDKHPGPLLDDGVDTATSARTSISCTCGAAHTLGSWALVDASLSADADGVHVGLTASTFTAGTNTSTILEIGTGAGGAETTWAKVLVGNRQAQNTKMDASSIYVPGFLAAGTRVSVRAQSVTASRVVSAIYSFLPATKTRGHVATPESMGFVTGSSIGTTLATAAVDTKAAWTLIDASTAAEYNSLLVCADLATDTAVGAGGNLVDIGIGAGGAETVLIPDIYIEQNASEYLQIRSPNTYGINIPAGSRLSARWSRNATTQSLSIALVGA